MFQEEEDEFVPVNKYSGPSLVNITDNVELYLFRMAPNMINPSDLINKEIIISKKQNHVAVKGKRVEIDAQKGNFLKTLTLMIPRSRDGDLVPAEKNISCQVVLKRVEEDVPDTNNAELLDSRFFESVIHQPPEVTRRDFYGPSDTLTERGRKSKKSSKKQKKESNIHMQESVKLDEENRSLNSSMKKLKNKRKRDESSDESSLMVKTEYSPESSKNKKKGDDSSLQLKELEELSVSKKKRRKLGTQ